jgi:hypothetical protein
MNEPSATLIPPTSAGPSRAVLSLLDELRRRVRAYVWKQGLAVLAALVGLWFWFSLAFDWIFEPPTAFRVALLVALGLALIYAAWRYLLRRAFAPLSDRSLALVLERRYPLLAESLLTTVELGETREHADSFDEAMLAHTRAQAEAAIGKLPLGEVFNRRPLRRAVSLATTLIVCVIAFAALAAPAMGVWVRRNLLLSDELWPRKTHLSVVGFEDGTHKKIAKGADFELLVHADAAGESIVPDVVEVRYRTADGARARERLNRSGVAQPGRDPYQEYTYQFKSMLADREFWVSGGDDREGPFYLDLVDSPTLTKTMLHCEYPAYMNRAPRDLAVTGLVQLPRGVEVTLEAEANKTIVSAQLDIVWSDGAPTAHKIDLVASTGEPQSHFSFPLGGLMSDATVLCTLIDSDHIHSRDAVRISLGALPDEPPQVNVQLEGIGTAITPSAMLPAAGEIADDYGLSKAWFEYRVDDGAPQQHALAVATDGRNQLPVHEALEVGSFGLKPKQKLQFSIQAADTFALGPMPNIASSQRYLLDVVTPEQLRAMLDARELMLRRRFETMIGELTETRDLLARVNLAPIATKAATDQPANEKPPAAPNKPAGDEPEDTIRNPASKSPEELKALARVEAERVVQNCQRSSHEIIEIADAFDAIRAELINNRVDTEELKSRLKEGISDPLRQIVSGRFPDLDKKLRALQTVLGDAEAAKPLKVASLAQADKILVEMKLVLDRMLELETFNEALDMLRAVIAAQERVTEETKKQQKAKLRELIEE